MTSYGSQLRNHIIHTVGLTLPDLAALIAPRRVMVINGSRDGLFTMEGIKNAHDKIRRCDEKAGVTDRQNCRVYDTPHEFNPEMQADAWAWLEKGLAAT